MNDIALVATIEGAPLSAEELELIHDYWCAANYLAIGQIYLLDNPLLQDPLRLEHIKPRLLGHWGTTPGLNLIYAHLNRVIKARDLNILFVTGPPITIRLSFMLLISVSRYIAGFSILFRNVPMKSAKSIA